MSENRERQLWCAVLHRAMQDATDRVAAIADAEAQQRLRQDALRWFTENGRDYRAACDAAGLDPDFLRSRVLTQAVAIDNRPATAGWPDRTGAVTPPSNLAD